MRTYVKFIMGITFIGVLVGWLVAVLIWRHHPEKISYGFQLGFYGTFIISLVGLFCNQGAIFIEWCFYKK